MWEIRKEIGFDYGHRVWSQKLNKEFSIDGECVCRHLHGHRGSVYFYLAGDTLDGQGMVTDFKHLNWAKKFLDSYIDHKFIVDRNDPLFNNFTQGKTLLPVVMDGLTVGYTLDLTGLTEGTPEFEYFESFFVVDFIPTSERLAKWCYEWAARRMANLGVTVQKIEWWETPKSCATYVGPKA